MNPENYLVDLFGLNTENYLVDPLFADTETHFGVENVRNNEKLDDSMPRQNDVITLKDLIHSFLLEFSPNGVSHLDDMTRQAEDTVPMRNKRYAMTNMLQRRAIKGQLRLSPLKHLMSSKFLRINKKKNNVESNYLK